MYDAQLDPVIPEYFSDYLESVHKIVCGDFQSRAGGENVYRSFSDA